MAGFIRHKSVVRFLLDAFDEVVGADAPNLAERRRAFASANILAGSIGAMLWVGYWAFLGPADVVTGLALLLLLVPLIVGLWVHQGGELARAEDASTACLGGLVFFAVLYTGGLSSPLLPWLLIVPIEASLTQRQSAVTVCAVAMGGAFLTLLALALLDWQPASRLDPAFNGFAYAVSLFSALIVGTLIVRTAHRRKEQRIEGAQAEAMQYRQLTEGAADLLTHHATDGTILYASPATQDMLGLDPDDMRGLKPAMIIHIQDLQSFERAFERVNRGIPQTVSFRLRRRDGGYVPVEMRAQLASHGIVGVIRDVSEVQAEIVELRSRCNEADEALRARTRFLASVTHELRTPLNAIVGFSDVMRNEVFGPVGHAKYREYADHIRDSGMHLTDVVSDLLDLSKIEAGKFTIDRRPCSLDGIAEACIAMAQEQAAAAGVALVLDVPNVSMTADARALKQCLINLLSNAIKFTPADGRVTLWARVQGNEVVVKVIDTGVGIPERDLQRIGKPFEQVEGAIQRTHTGTGLGLSLVKSLTELHGGVMTIESALGDGTVVTLRFPTAASAVAPSGSDNTLIYPSRFRARA